MSSLGAVLSMSSSSSAPNNHHHHSAGGGSSSQSPQDVRHLQITKKKRKVAGNPDPDAQVVALSPESLLATNRYVCEICNKGFQREQNLQLHRRGHNLPWNLRNNNIEEDDDDLITSNSRTTGTRKVKKAYVCPEPTCVHHHPSRALGDLTGIKKHFCRKHGEKKWKCQRCSKLYAVRSDWKAHTKICGTRDHLCDSCGTLFTRKDRLASHRAFCDAVAVERARVRLVSAPPPPPAAYPPPILAPPLRARSTAILQTPVPLQFLAPLSSSPPPPPQNPNPNPNPKHIHDHGKMIMTQLMPSSFNPVLPPATSARRPPFILQLGPAAQPEPEEVVRDRSTDDDDHNASTTDGFTRDFLGLTTAKH
ncbi:zinc finger protein MAGPIE-like [Andrographis paniculata]|uniref:zinc finger protein MAGPIE-like n=1 Tax=Andrographis paniculata TaxID=175694 RepID=UPI0021E8FC07|nr:zinc finger protein MAGPIE-like [Andrographis paniculata]